MNAMRSPAASVANIPNTTFRAISRCSSTVSKVTSEGLTSVSASVTPKMFLMASI